MMNRTFGPLYVQVSADADHVLIEATDLGWKYGVPVYESPGVVASTLRQIANWLDKVSETQQTEEKNAQG